MNYYTYVYNTPLIYVDPSGNVWKWVNDTWVMVKKGAKATADFLIMDDLRTLVDPKSSNFDKAMAASGFLPVGKFVKGGKLIVKWANKEGKVVNKTLKACNCFTAGTKVLTDEGEKPIEEIEIGDKVLAKSDETGEVAYREVVGLFQKQDDEIYKVYIGNEVIEATAEHPFWLDGKGWTFVKDLKVVDLLVSSDGTKLAIDKIEKEPREATVYNFEVADFHSYFVSNLGIWVHNCALQNVYKSIKDAPLYPKGFSAAKTELLKIK
ncbi:HINT domain-containing protein [Paenibacillus sp. 598K]|uniref:HINT domain-containing protein n=1 Tax=Paenibacillus sp. 598K TaxID=1117987 RepID=UPI0021A98974|nr:HINT domain-containing protein [Paenibacillus sp. 598K]